MGEESPPHSKIEKRSLLALGLYIKYVHSPLTREHENSLGKFSATPE